MGKIPHLVVIDGMSFFFRAYHAVRGNLTREDGLPTNALFGFAQMLVKVVDTLAPDLCCVALDSKAKTFRSEIYPAYKAHRPPPEENMVKQFPYFIPMVESFGIPAIGVEGVEADDIIATLVREQRARYGDEAQVTIVSSDKDLMQLLGGKVRMLDTLKDKYFGPAEVVEKFGVGPDKVIEVQALIGDSSDNVPGVPGIGPKTAAELIQAYGDVAGIYENLDAVGRDKLRENLRAHREQAEISRQLVTLKGDVVLPAVDMRFHPHLHEAAEYLQHELEFRTLAARLLKRRQTGVTQQGSQEPGSQVAGTSEAGGWGDYECVTTPERWQWWLAEARSRGAVAFDTETTSLDPYMAQLVGLSLALAPGLACYVPVKAQGTGNKEQENGQGDLFGEAEVPAGPHGVAGLDVLADLRALLADETVKKIGHNLKYDWLVVARALGIIPEETGAGLQGLVVNYEDTMLMSACLDGGRWGHGLDDSALRHLGHAMIPYSEVCGKGKAMITFDRVELDRAVAYAAEDADATFRLWETFSGRMRELHGGNAGDGEGFAVISPVVFKENLENSVTAKRNGNFVAPPDGEPAAMADSGGFGPGFVYRHVERPLLPVIAALEARGVAVDEAALRKLSADFAVRLGVLEREIWNLCGKEFNVQSTQQLAVVLFDEMGLGSDKQRKNRSTSVDVLEDLSGPGSEERGGEVARKVLQYRQLAKLRSTYAEALVQQINPITGRVHTNYQQMGAATGRFSSSEPNLQNIPIRTEEGRKIRHAFVPRGPRGERDWVMVSADYSQIELRLLAHFSGSEALRAAFREGLDIHAYTASLIHGVDMKDVSKDQRRAAKVINFGLVYGMGARSMAAGIGSSVAEAQAWIEAYFRRYEGVREYMELNKRLAREKGYVETLCGRRVWLPEINSANGGLRAGAERAAINAPLQGSNADVIKLAMVAVEKRLQRFSTAGTGCEERGTRAPAARLLMQVHDELVLECAPDVVDEVKALLPEVMGGVVELAVPLAVEVGVGANWEAAH